MITDQSTINRRLYENPPAIKSWLLVLDRACVNAAIAALDRQHNAIVRQSQQRQEASQGQYVNILA